MTKAISARLLVIVALSVSLAHFAARWVLLSSRRFDSDEFEHAHVAWCILNGQLPYRDFFEHHTPLFHYLLAFVLSTFDVNRSSQDAMIALVGARYISWVVSVAIVVVTFFLARRLRDSTTAWVALPLVSGNFVVALRAIEIRPDGLSTLLWLCSLIAYHAAVLCPAPSSGRPKLLFALAGISIALAVLTSQKLLLAGAPLLVLTVWYAVSARFAGGLRDRLLNAGSFAAAVTGCWCVAFVYFASHGALGEFLRLTVLESARWKSESTAATILTFVMQYEPWLFALAAAGALLLLRERRPERQVTSNVLLLVSAGGMFLGLFLVPVPYAQYCLTFLPLFAILAASFLVELTRELARRRPPGALRPSPSGVLIGVVAIALSVLGLTIARPTIVAPGLYPIIVVGGLVSLALLPWYRRPEIALSVVILALTALPMQWTRWMLALTDRDQRVQLRYVLEHTATDDVVLDGWSGNGVFRRHAGYYWMFHPGVRAMLPASVIDGLVRDLRSGRIEPKIVILDSHLRALSPDLETLVRSRYRPTGVGDIYARPPDLRP